MPVGLEDVLATDALATRPSRAPDHRAEADALAALARVAAEQPQDLLQKLADTVVSIGIAASAGVCFLDGDGDDICRRVISGRWPDGGDPLLPLDQTPSGVAIARDEALLFRDPKRYFPALDIKPGIREMLIVPIHSEGAPIGALWAATHDRDDGFNREHVRLLGRLATFASIAWQRARAPRAGPHPSEAVFRHIVESVPLLLWRATDAGQWTWASPHWAVFTGQSEATSHAYGWLEAVHPDDRRPARRAWRQARGAEAFEVEYRILCAAEQEYRWFKTRAMPVRDQTGAIIEWVGTSTDIDGFKQVREHEQALLSELQHRVRNTLAVVRSIARRTADNSDSVEDFQMHFDGRIGAFARAQSLVTRNVASGVDLETLIAEELLAHHVHEGEQATIAGPSVRLKPKIADTIGLAIHELTVNAIKHGGLSSDAGRVSVSWVIDDTADEPILALTWIDGAADRTVSPPRHQGFGSELIERSLVYELDAVTRMRFEPHGLHCDIRLPLTGRLA